MDGGRDRRGRLRRPDQGRGLRPLHPLLPEQWTSKALRVAMAERDWEALEALARAALRDGDAPTQARAYGLTIARLLRHAPPPEPAPLDWMDWERRKALRLLSRGN